ncbi:hypothetical protein [Saccharothrix algeriensis]|nr:hypothetical protein [Saccharothrix algeriensis]
MRTLLLGALYFLVVTPIGLVARLVRDPMARRWDENAQSYWIPSSKGRKH